MATTTTHHEEPAMTRNDFPNTTDEMLINLFKTCDHRLRTEQYIDTDEINRIVAYTARIKNEITHRNLKEVAA
jgi:hypothetical protein